MGLRVHGDVKGIAPYYLVDVRGLGKPRVDQGVHAGDDELGATEANHLLRRRFLRQ